MSEYKKKSITQGLRKKQEDVLLVKKGRAQNGSELSYMIESLKVLKPQREFETSLTMLEEFTGNLMEEIEHDRKHRGSHWKTTLKDYFTTTDSMLIRCLRILLAIVTFSVSVLVILLLLKFLLPPVTVSTGMLLMPLIKGSNICKKRYRK